MRYALIDNATLTSTQRLLGEAPVFNKTIIDNDILSFENLLQAILFYDSLICIDDYKPEYAEGRLNSFPLIKPIPTTLFDYNLFVKQANNVTEDITLDIQSGKITNKDIKAYFDSLGMTFSFTWDIASSHFFLTQKMLLGESKINLDDFNKIYYSIYNEKNESYTTTNIVTSKSPKLYNSRGDLIFGIDQFGNGIDSTDNDESLSDKFKSFVSSLSWLAQRTAFYTFIADYLYADLFLQPIRHNFLDNIINRVYQNHNGIGLQNSFLHKNSKKAQDVVNEIMNDQQISIKQNIPLFCAYFTKITQDPTKILSAAYEVREDKPFVETRAKLRELNIILVNEDYKKYRKEINLLNLELDELFDRIRSRYSLNTNQGVSLSNIMFFIGLFPKVTNLELPDKLDIKIKALDFLKDIIPLRGIKAVYKNIIEDLASVERLGKYHDILTSNIYYTKSAGNFSIKTELPTFQSKTSWWKKPMS